MGPHRNEFNSNKRKELIQKIVEKLYFEEVLDSTNYTQVFCQMKDVFDIIYKELESYTLFKER